MKHSLSCLLCEILTISFSLLQYQCFFVVLFCINSLKRPLLWYSLSRKFKALDNNDKHISIIWCNNFDILSQSHAILNNSSHPECLQQRKQIQVTFRKNIPSIFQEYFEMIITIYKQRIPDLSSGFNRVPSSSPSDARPERDPTLSDPLMIELDQRS